MKQGFKHSLKLSVLIVFAVFSWGVSMGAKAGVQEKGRSMTQQQAQPQSAAVAAETGEEVATQFQYDTFPTSLHATREGKVTWYSAENGGFEQFTNVPMSELNCTKCHPSIPPDEYTPDCTDCHQAIGDPVPDSTCLSCHSRQGLEMNLGYSDVHRDAGFLCRDCHTSREMHGDGIQYSSWLEPGAMDVQCANCHQRVAQQNVSHLIHFSTVDCSACHTQSVVTCYNCHFESEVAGNRKRFYGPPMKDWVLLLRREGSDKVHAANFQSVVFQGQSFVALAPYRAHTITKEARDCEECHNSPALGQYLETGKITVTQWDGEKLVNTKGIIPIPPDWQQALQFDFVDYKGDPAADTDPTQWEFLKSGADGMQMLFAKPLTAEQMEKLETFGN